MSTALDVTLKVLYVQGPDPGRDAVAIEQLRKVAAELQITTIAGPAAALAELRRTPGWQALLASPSLPQNETLALITSLRRDRIPIAIVPIVDESHQDLFASAVASGADDVLVRRGDLLVNVSETLTRIRQSPHLFPAEQRRRISVLYAGRDPLVWNLLDQVPFAKAERVTVGQDGVCPVRKPGAADNSLRADAVIIDEQPGEAHPLQVLKSVKAQASDLPVIVLTSTGAADIATAALELGADDTVLKTGIFRRRLIATLRRVHQRLELTAQQVETKAREERLRQIVENVPTGIIVIGANGHVLAMNAAALHLFGATKPRDIVGRDFRQMVAPPDHAAIVELIRSVTRGEPGAASFEALTLDGGRVAAHLQAVVLERDARGGRGVVASITTAAARPDAPGRQEELAGLQESLQRMEQHFAELEQARSGEQMAWETERRRLEARLEDAERLAAERASLEERLDEVTAELTRTSQSFADERQSLEVRLRDLEAAARDASTMGATRDELERALAAVRDEQQQAIEAHALERSGWEAIRTELESRVRDLGATHETETASIMTTLQAEMLGLQQTFASERERWTATHEQLESELRNAREALWAEHTERDRDRAAADAEAIRVRESHETEAADWSAARAALEQAAADARAAAEAIAGERDRTRTQLEDELTGLREAVSAESAARTAAAAEREQVMRSRDELEQDLVQVRQALDNERLAWQHRRAELERDVRTAQDGEGAYRELVAVRGRLEAELEEARQQIALERGAAEAIGSRAREDLERAQEATRAIAEEYDATRARLEAERDAARQALDADRLVWEADRAGLQTEMAEAVDRAARLAQQIEDDRRDRGAAHEQMLAAAQGEWHAQRDALDAELQAARRREDDSVLAYLNLEESMTRARRDAEEAQRAAEAGLHDEIAGLRADVARAEAARDDAQARVAALVTEIDEARHAHAGDRSGLAGELDAARQERDDLRRDRDDAKNLFASLQQTHDEAVRGIDTLRSDHAAATTRLSSVLAELDELRRVHAEDRGSLAAELDGTRNERDALLNERDGLRFERDDLRGQRDDAQRARDDASRKADTLQAEHDETLTRSSALAAALDDARRVHAADRDHLAAELDDTRRDRDDLRARFEQAREQLGALSSELHDLRHVHAGERGGLAAEVERLQQEAAALRADRDQVVDRLTSLSAELDDARHRAEDRDQLAAALDAARSEIRHTDAAHHAERDGWERARGALEQDVRQARSDRDSDRDAWSRARQALEADARESTRLADELRLAQEALGAARTDYATLAGTLADERTRADQARDDADALRRALDDAEARRTASEDAMTRTARSLQAQLETQAVAHDAAIRDLEADLHRASDRLAQATIQAEARSTELRAGYARAWESHARLVATALFGYAVTTQSGDLLRCNDAFARMFGYVNAAELLARTAGRPFKPLSGRGELLARLAAAGRIDRVESCVERVDGQAMRLTESLVLAGSEDHPETRVIEHIVLAAPAGPTEDEVQQRRLQDVGALASAMTPELESLTARVEARGSELRRQVAEGRAVEGHDVDDLRSAVSRMGSLVRQLAGFSRRQAKAAERVELGAAIANAEAMLERLAGDYVSFSVVRAQTTTLQAQTADLDQLLTSLVTSGRDLLPRGGALTLECAQHEGTGDSDAGPFNLPGPMVSLRAVGYGVKSPDTTATLDAIARRCGGHLRVQGEAGRDVRIDVLFPRCAG